MQAGDELGEAERLGQVVVGAERQALDELVGRARGGEHQDLRARLLGGQGPADHVAVDLGQVAVEHDDVVGIDARLVERGGAVGGDVDGHSLAPEAARDRGGDAGLVLGDQDSHVRQR